MVEFWARLRRLLVWALLLPIMPVFGAVGEGASGDGGGEDDDPDGDGDDQNQDGEGQEGRTFSQAELDATIKKRLERERSRFADYADLKAKAEELQKLQDADLSEREKLEKRIVEMEQAKAEAKSVAEAREMEVNERLIRAEVRVVAAGLGFVNPEDAYGLADLADVSVKDDGSVVGVEKALKVLEKAKPYLLENGKGGVGTPPRGKGRDRAADSSEAGPTKSIVRW